MNLYEIDRMIADELAKIFDIADQSETGEIPDYLDAVLNALQVERDKKLGNIGRYIINAHAEAEACKAQADKFTDRYRALENRVDRLKQYLDASLRGEKWKDDCVTVSYRTSHAVEVLDEAKVPDEYWKIERSIKLKDINAAITKANQDFEWAKLVERRNIQVK
jgi:seryl-tRNA synthetase